ncbi:MAG: shikimate dehydrogenase [Gammaproteobacteria bacterium]|nr:shikimate dehydrogenase [Gammaproteobacteria bacterium]
MSDLFDFKTRPSGYAVMGNPVTHSKSPLIHHLFAQQTGIEIRYDRIQVDVGGFGQAVSHFSANGGAGLNITVPFKVEAWQLCQTEKSRISPRAQLAESVNTLQFNGDGTLFGDNTDGPGLVADLQNNLGFGIQDKSILLIGAGGAVRGVLGSLHECNPERIVIANRTADKAVRLSKRFDQRVEGTGLHRVPNDEFDLVINGTAASLGGTLPGIDKKCLGADTAVYDMMYADQPTVFMKWGLSNGAAHAHDGLGMLVEQAAESFYVWHRKRPDSQPVIHAIRKEHGKTSPPGNLC